MLTSSLAGTLSRARLSRALDGVLTLGLLRGFTGVLMAVLPAVGVCGCSGERCRSPGVLRMWTRFLLRVCPVGVSTTYDRGSGHFSRITPSFHLLEGWSWNLTSWPGVSGGKSLAFLSWYAFWVVWRFCSRSRTRSSAWFLVCLVGRFPRGFLPVRSSRGLGIFGEIGVVRMHRRVRSGSLPSCLALVRAILTVWTCLSM